MTFVRYFFDEWLEMIGSVARKPLKRWGGGIYIVQNSVFAYSNIIRVYPYLNINYQQVRHYV